MLQAGQGPSSVVQRIVICSKRGWQVGTRLDFAPDTSLAGHRERRLEVLTDLFVVTRGKLRRIKMQLSKGWAASRIGPSLWVAVLIYVVLSVLMTWPLTAQLNTHFPSPDTDVFNGYWSNWWFRQALTDGQNPYVTSYLLYPVGFDVVAFGFSPFLALLWIPINWLVPALAAFNLVFLVTIVLSSLAMDQLVRYLTGNGYAALVAGITFGFAPSLVAERLPHVSKASLFWIPWALLVLTRLVREAKWRDALLLAAIVGLAFLTLPQVGILVLMSCGIYFIGLLVVERKAWHKLAVRRLLLGCLLSLLVLTPVLGYAWQLLLQPGGDYLLEWGAEQSQTDLLAYVVPPHQHPVFGSLSAAIEGGRFVLEGQYWVYLGLVPAVLALYATASRPRKALPWVLLGGVFFVLALGPNLRFGGEVYPAIKLPYSLAQGLFSAAGLNTPNRFNMGLMVAVSVLAGLSCAQLSARWEKSWLLGIAAALILFEYLVAPLPTVLPPEASAFYEQIAAEEEDYAILDLPLTRPAGEVHRYYQTLHGKPIVGGWIKRVPASAFDFVDANPLLALWHADDVSTPVGALGSALAYLAEANVRYIIFHKNQLSSVPESTRVLLASVRPIFSDANILVLPTESRSGQGYYVAQWFDGQLGLLRPVAFLQMPEVGGSPQLSFAICWLRDGEGGDAERYEVTLAGPEGTVVYAKSSSLPSPAQGLSCRSHVLELEQPPQNGAFTLNITPFAGGRSLGTYSTTQAVLALPQADGEPMAAMGSSCYVPFDAAIELLGYDLMAGDGFAWVDLYWRSTEAHQRSYPRAITLIDRSTGQSIGQTMGTIDKQGWEKGELYQERVVLWLEDALPEDPVLGIELAGNLITDGCRADLLVGEYVEALAPGQQVYVSPIPSDDSDRMSGLNGYPDLKEYDGRACLVAPEKTTRDTSYIIIPQEDTDSLRLLGSYFLQGEIVAEGPLHNGYPFFVAFRVPADSTAEIAPAHPMHVDWEGKIRLLGYDIDAEGYAPGDEIHLILYYLAMKEMDSDYTLFVHVVGANESRSERLQWGQNDSEPCRRSYPTSRWTPGEIVRDEVVVATADDTPPGEYQLSVGFYLLETMTRLAARDAAGVAFPEDAVQIGQFQVEAVSPR